MTGKLEKCKAFLLDIIFPNRCPFCGSFIMWNEFICKACDENIEKANDAVCRSCGKRKCVCGSGNTDIDMVFASFFYNDSAVKNAVMSLKLRGEINIAAYTAKDIAFRMEKENIPKPDMIVPVPMGRKKQRKRGYNQAELLAEQIGRYLGVPVDKNILFKYDTKEEQHNFGMKSREERVKGLFYKNDDADLSGKRVLICDDVMTTGATLNECSVLLKSLGAVHTAAAVCAVTELNTTLGEDA